jgi:protein transport protein SEC24
MKIEDKQYAPLGDNGLPINYEDRPELYKGTYEFKVGEGYSIRPPIDPTYLFIIDVTVSSLESGIPHMVFQSLREIVKDKLLNGEEKARFGILCFDSRIHLVTINPAAKKPKIITMVGNFDQCPIPVSSILMTIEDFSDPEVFALLETIPDSFHRMGDISKAIPIRS